MCVNVDGYLEHSTTAPQTTASIPQERINPFLIQSKEKLNLIIGDIFFNMSIVSYWIVVHDRGFPVFLVTDCIFVMPLSW